MRVVTLDDGTRAFCLRRFEARVIDRDVRGYLTHGIRVAPGDVVLDVGANIGLFGLRLLQRCQGNLQLYCIEPIPDIRAVLERNLAGTGALILPWAIGKQPGNVVLEYFPRSPCTSTAGGADGNPEQWARVVRDSVRADPRFGRVARLVPAIVFRLAARYLRAASRKIPCQQHTLSELIESHRLGRIALLKLDIEGSELDALRGIQPAHWPLIGQLVAEVHDRRRDLATIEALLRDHGLANIRVVPEVDSSAEPCPCCMVYATRTPR